MSEQLGPLEVCCDAPSYNIVRACAQVGFRTPEDVRWRRMSRHLEEQGGRRELANAVRALLGFGLPAELTCTCGQRIDAPERFTFVLATGRELTYLLAQCSRCATIFWEEA